MTYGQRKTHLIIWVALSIIIPVLMVGSVLQIRTNIITDGEVSLSQEALKGHIVLDNPYFAIEVITQGTRKSLKTIVKKPLKSPSVIAYAVKNDGSETILGTLEAKGVYTFPIDQETKSVRVYDGIKSIDLINIVL